LLEEEPMIPTMIAFGLVTGRWWKTSLVTGTLVWPLLLVVSHVPLSPTELLGAAAFGLANTVVGVLVHQLVLRLIRLWRYKANAARHST
jgi:hypothetical protein